MTAGPPDLAGYEFVDELGSGGFADVYRYRHHLGREVAVKVLRDPTIADRFQDEARRTAALSTHPAIVTIYEVGVAADGRPYLAMEHCPGGHLGTLALERPLGVPRALTIGIRLAAAVETAHRNGILHRDIKPANVLITEFGEPVLIDFGIAGGVDELAGSQGLSVPFAAPEVITSVGDGDVRSDVYSLGATVYALLAGRSPFHTGEPLADSALVERILHAPLPPTGRADVPPALERALSMSLARRPADRFDTAAAFGRALQAVERDLGLPRTALVVPDDTATRPAGPPPVADDDPGRTRVKPFARVDPTGATPPTPAPTTAAPPPPAATWSTPGAPAGPAATGMGDRTVGRAGPTVAPEPEAPASDGDRASTGRLVAIGAAAVVLVGAGAFLFSRIGGTAEDDAPTTTTTPDTSSIVLGSTLARPERVRIDEDGSGDGQVVVWSAPSAEEGDEYRITITDGPAELRGDQIIVGERTYQLDTPRRVCVRVETYRGGRLSDASQEVCSR